MSCSLSSLFIGKLDYYITTKTADRLNLYVKQEDKLRQKVKILLDDIKPEAKIINKNLKLIAKNPKQKIQTLSTEELINLYFVYEQINLKLGNTVGFFLADLTKKQQKMFLDDLEEKVKKRNKKIKKGKFYKTIIERLEKLVGELSPEQKLVIKKQKNNFTKWQLNRAKQNEVLFQELKIIFKLEKAQRLEKINALFVNFREQLKGDIKSDLFKELFTSIKIVFQKMNEEQFEKFNERIEFFTEIIDSFIEHKYNKGN